MAIAKCYWNVCFAPLEVESAGFFGFSEYLAGLALMALVWTIADERYRFRVKTAPFPIQDITYSIVALVGFLTLFTDLWRAEKWPVPVGSLITPHMWQAILGGLLLITFLFWVFYAFIRPPIYTKHNAKIFADRLYKVILRGNPQELAIVADELSNSAKNLVFHATNRDKNQTEEQFQKVVNKRSTASAYADELLLLIGDRAFCRVVTEYSPGTALSFFQEVNKTKKYGVQLEQFAQNIMAEALENKNSFLFRESSGYETGLLGYTKPLTRAMFSSYQMIESFQSVLDIPSEVLIRWDSAQWKAYCRAVLTVSRDVIDNNNGESSLVLYRAIRQIPMAIHDLYLLDSTHKDKHTDLILDRFSVAVNFITEFLHLLNTSENPLSLEEDSAGLPSLPDQLLSLTIELIDSTSRLRSSTTTNSTLVKNLQKHLLWDKLFPSRPIHTGKAVTIFRQQVYRAIYEHIKMLEQYISPVGENYLRFSLNVFGLRLWDRNVKGKSYFLHKVICSWLKQNFVNLHVANSDCAKKCLPYGINYNEKTKLLINTLPAGNIEKLFLDPYSPRQA